LIYKLTYLKYKKNYFYIIMEQRDALKKIISHSKEYGFVIPSSEIYEGLNAV